MGDITLRGLAKDFSQGVINKEDYRRARAELISGILEGRITLAAIEYPSLVMPNEQESITEPRHLDKTRIISEPATPSPPSPVPQNAGKTKTEHHWLLIASVIAALCLAVILIILLRPSATRQAALENGSSPAPVATESVAASEQVEQMIREFLSQKNWSAENLQTFLSEWDQLSETEKLAGRESSAMHKLADAIYRRLLEEQALAGIGDSDSSQEKQLGLVTFAKTLGIEDARIKTRDVPVIEKPASVAVAETDTAIPPPVTTTPGKDIQAFVEYEETETPESSVDETMTDAEDSNPVLDTDLTEDQTDALEETDTELPNESDAITSPPEEAELAVPAAMATAEQAMDTEQSGVSAAATEKRNSGGCRASLVKNRKPYCRDRIDGIGNGPTMVVIPDGKFLMGGEQASEQPAHEVTIPGPFAMSVHEITNSEFELSCKNNGNTCPPQPWSGGDYPVVNITWKDAVNYTDWLSAKTGRKYRLPTEAEWEYAARAGTTTTYPGGDKILITDAVYSDRKTRTAPLPKTDRTINRNRFRLYHMLGNVREWVADSWHDSYEGASDNGKARDDKGNNLRVVRGGSYQDTADALRSGAREKMALDSADEYTGFRIVQELPANES